ncbi:hypothetical protein KRR40_45780 [Niabella defluvii]|nr:hypothetical protein KRR40_45780 [Niabella sp. I65]
MMNIPYDSAIVFEELKNDLPATTPRNAAGIYQTALEQLALVKAVDLRTFSAQKALKVARGGLWPTLSLGGNAYTQYSSVAQQTNYRIPASGKRKTM